MSCRDHATEHLQSLQASDTEKQRMLQILQRLQQPDDAELSDSVSDNADDSDVGLSHQLQAKLSMMVCVCKLFEFVCVAYQISKAAPLLNVCSFELLTGAFAAIAM